jgi:hypothetical protein
MSRSTEGVSSTTKQLHCNGLTFPVLMWGSAGGLHLARAGNRDPQAPLAIHSHSIGHSGLPVQRSRACVAPVDAGAQTASRRLS